MDALEQVYWYVAPQGAVPHKFSPSKDVSVSRPSHQHIRSLRRLLLDIIQKNFLLKLTPNDISRLASTILTSSDSEHVLETLKTVLFFLVLLFILQFELFFKLFSTILDC